MAETAILYLFGVLSLAVALNLVLTLRLAARIAGPSTAETRPFTAPIGETLPDFSGQRLEGGQTVASGEMEGRAHVLIFLSAACTDCRGKLPELTTLRPAMHAAGVTPWIVATDSPRRTRAFLSGTPLVDDVVLIDRKQRRALNPRNAAPFYLFVDHERRLLASNFIGDENWLAFVQQVRNEAAPKETRQA